MQHFALTKQGESLTFFTEPNPRAPRCENEVRLRPGAVGPPPHIHTKQDESFHVLSGRLIAIVEGKEITVEPGETCVVRAGQVHTFRNGSSTEELVVRGGVEPELHFQWFLMEGAKSAIRAGGGWDDMPLFEVAYLLYAMRNEYRVAGMPYFLQDTIFGLLATIAVVTGKHKNIAPKPKESEPQDGSITNSG
jgi:quercetin dioxygenase-like cupin family protein